MADLFDDPDVAGVLAHCSGEWGSGALSFDGGSPEAASFFDAGAALPALAALAEGMPQAGPSSAAPDTPPHLQHVPLSSLVPPAPLPPACAEARGVELPPPTGACSAAQRRAAAEASEPQARIDAALRQLEDERRQRLRSPGSLPSLGSKRRCCPTASEPHLDSSLERLRHEYEELLRENRALQGKCAAAEAQVAAAVRAAAAERQMVAALLDALSPYKTSLALAPQESVASTLTRFGSASLAPELEADAGAPESQAGAAASGAKPPGEALAEVVAAAALAVNMGNPAAALLDLLSQAWAQVVRRGILPTHRFYS